MPKIAATRERVRDPNLPRWPHVYTIGQNPTTAIVTGRHGTIPRYRTISGVLRLATIAGVLACIALAGSFVFKDSNVWSRDQAFNTLQQYRLAIDRWLIVHIGADRLRSLPWPVTQFQMNTGLRLNWLAWSVIAVVWLSILAMLRMTTRRVLAGFIFARRTTVKITPSHVVIYRARIFPQRFLRELANTIQFKIEPHPRLLPGRNVSALHVGVYQDAGQVVMMYGVRVVPIAIIIGIEAAKQFAVCCDAAVTLVKGNRATVSNSIRNNLE